MHATEPAVADRAAWRQWLSEDRGYAVRVSAHRILALLFTLSVAACGSPVPSPAPASLVSLRGEMALLGVTTVSAVAGESVCPEQPLHDNALALSVTTPSDPRPRDVYLYLFRPRLFEATASMMDACAAQYESAAPGATIDRLDVAPFRALGADWSDELRSSVESAMHVAARGGR
jgi:hypothetical protein